MYLTHIVIIIVEYLHYNKLLCKCCNPYVNETYVRITPAINLFFVFLRLLIKMILFNPIIYSIFSSSAIC